MGGKANDELRRMGVYSRYIGACIIVLLFDQRYLNVHVPFCHSSLDGSHRDAVMGRYQHALLQCSLMLNK